MFASGCLLPLLSTSVHSYMETEHCERGREPITSLEQNAIHYSRHTQQPRFHKVAGWIIFALKQKLLLSLEVFV